MSVGVVDSSPLAVLLHCRELRNMVESDVMFFGYYLDRGTRRDHRSHTLL